MDRELYRAVNRLAVHTGWLHAFLAPYALWGGLVVLVALVAVGWLRARHSTTAVQGFAIAFLTGLGAVVALAINSRILSPWIGRTRPCHTLRGVEVLLTCSPDHSMPSDHCVIAGALTVGLWLLDRRLGVSAAVLSLLLAFSRVYVGVHYPSDVLVGLALGVALGLLVVLALRPAGLAVARRISEGPLAVLVRARDSAAPART